MNAHPAMNPLGGKAASSGENKPGFRSKTIATRLTPGELAEVETAAEQAGKPLAEWLREAALNAARERATDPVELLLAEVWAVRYAVLNLFRAGAQANIEGKAMPPEFVARIRQESDAQKHQQARILIEEFARSREKKNQGD